MSNRQFEAITSARSDLTPVYQREGPEAAAVQLTNDYPRIGIVSARGGRPAHSGASLLQLQRGYGNRYVQQVVERGAPAPVVQTKLVLGPADDRYERQADRVAQQVTSGASQPALDVDSRAPAIQRLATAAGGAVDAGVQQAIQAARGGGQPLPDHVRVPMEQGLETDFGGVRLHSDARADQLNHALQARAFTTGQDIFFRRGEYRPGSSGGRELLAHELTHVVQQHGTQHRAPWNDTVGAIQRTVGFEFETKVRMSVDEEKAQQIKTQLKEQRSQHKWQVSYDMSELRAGTQQLSAEEITPEKDLFLKNKEQLSVPKRQLWYIEPDSGNLEIVTKELKDGAQVDQTIAEIANFARNGDAALAKGETTLGTVMKATWGDSVAMGAAPAIILRGNNFDAQPQATVGIKAQKLPNLLLALTQQQLPEGYRDKLVSEFGGNEQVMAQMLGGTTLLRGSIAPVAQGVAQKVTNFVLSTMETNQQLYSTTVATSELFWLGALLTQVLWYLESIPKIGSVTYPKEALALMSRHNFHDLYEKTQGSKGLFTIELIEELSGRGRNERIYAGEMKTGFSGPRIGDWIQSIVDPTKMTAVDIGERSEHQAAAPKDYSETGQDILTASARDVGAGMGSQTYPIRGVRLLHEIRSLNEGKVLYPPTLWAPLARVIWQLHANLE